MAKRANLIGERFGRWVIIERSISIPQKTGTKILWLCVCDCGNNAWVQTTDLKSGKSKSCGCFKREVMIERQSTHNKTGTPEYWCWAHIKSRCYNISDNAYYNYGGRGIKVCERWLNSFEIFLEDMGLRPSPLHSIDRFPDVNGDYKPSNCRWATILEQNRNQRKNKLIEFNGEFMLLVDWSKRFGVNSGRISRCLKTKTMQQIVEYYKQKGIIK